MNNGAKLPQSLDAEKGLLGSILLAPGRVLDECLQRQVSEKHFHHPAHATVFDVLVDMREANKPIDLISLTQLLEDRHLLEEIGGAAAVTDLFTFVPTASNAAYYIEILREKALARHVIEAATEITAIANNPREQARLSDKVRDVLSSITLLEPNEGELFVDLEEIINGGLQPERPTVAEILPGKCLLYAGRLNEIHAEPSIGKTNIAINIASSVLSDGGHVLFIDPEDTAIGTLNRLISFGVNPSWIVEGFHYLHNPTPQEFDRAISWASKNKQTLVCLDGLAEAMAAELKDENNVSDVLTFFRQRLRPFAEQGAAVLIDDHVTKSTEGRGRWARGSGAKLGRYDGVSYSAELVQAYSPTVAGKVRLRVSKDRNGGIGVAGQIVTEINFTPKEGKTLVTFQEPVEGKPFKPTAIMAKICKHLELFPDSSKRDLYHLGAHEWVEEAITHLVKDGFLNVTKIGQRVKFTVLKIYSE